MFPFSDNRLSILLNDASFSWNSRFDSLSFASYFSFKSSSESFRFEIISLCDSIIVSLSFIVLIYPSFSIDVLVVKVLVYLPLVQFLGNKCT